MHPICSSTRSLRRRDVCLMYWRPHRWHVRQYTTPVVLQSMLVPSSKLSFVLLHTVFLFFIRKGQHEHTFLLHLLRPLTPDLDGLVLGSGGSLARHSVRLMFGGWRNETIGGLGNTFDISWFFVNARQCFCSTCGKPFRWGQYVVENVIRSTFSLTTSFRASFLSIVLALSNEASIFL